MFEYALLQEAQFDFEESLLWYKERSTEAAKNFLAEVSAAIERFAKNRNGARRNTRSILNLD